MKRFSLTLGIGATLIASPTATSLADAPRKPNVVVIVADDLGYADVGFNGGKEIPTPNVDSLAAAGTRFANGYVSCPVCSPTRAGLVTGRYQQRFGHEFNPGAGGIRDDFGLPRSEKTIADALTAAGYKTGLVGKWHLGSADGYHPTDRGFAEYFGFLGGAHPYFLDEEGQAPILRGNEQVKEDAYLTDAIGREAVAFIGRHKAEPFYLQVTFNAVHTPLQAPQKYLDRFPNISDKRHQTYAAMLSALDDNVGLVLAKLHEEKLDGDTLVFFISDNGGPPTANTSNNHPFSGAKGSVWEGGIHIPFVLRWTGHVPAGAVYDQPVISLDVSATAAAVAGAKLGDGKPIDGVDLLPYVTGKNAAAPHAQLYWRFGPQWAIRQGNLKLLKLADGEPQLFDLSNDLGEKTDLAAAQPERVKELEKSYTAWDSELAKPLWQPARNQKQKQRRQQQRTEAKAS
jgi:arylsulfatase A-like enzyme